MMCFKAVVVLALSRDFQQGKQDYQPKPEETELVTRSTSAVTVRAGTNSATCCRSRGSPAMWRSGVDHRDLYGRGTITWNQNTLAQILFLVLTSCPTLGESFQLVELWSSYE